ncbi:MAG: glycosyltransferase [Candidatus Korarchaeota archaeon]|nr:glycosyltransferase [Thermoproteota archaeon]
MLDRKVTIIFFTPYLLPISGAVWRRIGYFSEYLKQKGFDTYVIGAIALERDIAKIIYQIKNLTKDYYFKVFNFQLMIPFSFWPIQIFNAIIGPFPNIILMLLLKPKVVVISIPYIEFLPLTFLGARLTGAKIVIDVRDPIEYWVSWNKGLTKKLFILIAKLNYLLMRNAHVIITVTPELARFLSRNGVYAYVIRNGADIRAFKPYRKEDARRHLGLAENMFIMVMNGYLGGYYDAKPLLKAIELLPYDFKRRILLLVVGGFSDPNYAREFAVYVVKRRLNDNVKILGKVMDADKLAKILSAADIGLIPQSGDPLLDFAIPAKFYEYIACGIPVLALTRKGSALWNIVNGWGVGYALEPNDVCSIAHAILDISAKSHFFREKILKMRDVVDRRREAEKLIALVRDLLEK